MNDVIILASGSLGEVALVHLNRTANIKAILTDRSSTNIHEISIQEDIPCFIGNPRNGKAYDFIKDISCDIILSINYLFIIKEDIIKHPKHYAINLHGSLLPKYRGRTPHVWSIINGEKETGVTAHLIEEDVDKGDIIIQQKINIEPHDSGGSIIDKFRTIYPQVIDNLMYSIQSNTINFYAQDNSKATYYGKRTPLDGCIQWNWHDQRIINWIRAQKTPYPGAFSIYRNQKVIIHSAQPETMGYSNSIPNGTILEVGSNYLIVKCPNKAVRIFDIEQFTNYQFSPNTTFDEHC